MIEELKRVQESMAFVKRLNERELWDFAKKTMCILDQLIQRLESEELAVNVAKVLFNIAKEKAMNPEPGLRISNFADLSFEDDGVDRDGFIEAARIVIGVIKGEGK